MSATGYIRLHAFESYARLPLKDVAVTVTSPDGTAIAMRVTDRNGQITPVEIPVPDLVESQSPDPPERPFALVNLYAHLSGYEQVEAENVQVFAETVTNQELMMIPLSELPNQWDQSVIYNTPPQNL
ncbi:MAG: hypothetical protein ACI3V0_05075 [Faecousia sp.]